MLKYEITTKNEKVEKTKTKNKKRMKDVEEKSKSPIIFSIPLEIFQQHEYFTATDIAKLRQTCKTLNENLMFSPRQHAHSEYLKIKYGVVEEKSKSSQERSIQLINLCLKSKFLRLCSSNCTLKEFKESLKAIFLSDIMYNEKNLIYLTGLCIAIDNPKSKRLCEEILKKVSRHIGAQDVQHIEKIFKKLFDRPDILGLFIYFFCYRTTNMTRYRINQSLQKCFEEASLNGIFETVEVLAPLVNVHYYNDKVLADAVCGGNIEIIDLLLRQYGCLVNQQVLFTAINWCRKDILLFLLEFCPINCVTFNNYKNLVFLVETVMVRNGQRENGRIMLKNLMRHPHLDYTDEKLIKKGLELKDIGIEMLYLGHKDKLPLHELKWIVPFEIFNKYYYDNDKII